MSTEDVFKICERKLDGSRYDELEIRDAIDEAEHEIRSFTGRWQTTHDDLTDTDILEELPSQINYTWANVAIGILSLNYYISQASLPSADYGIVKTIKEGDTSIEYSSTFLGIAGNVKSAMDIVNSYANELHPFRRLYSNIKEVDIPPWTSLNSQVR